MPATGTVRVGDRTWTLQPNALALYDWTASTPPRATTWNWAAGAGVDETGAPIGLNFSRGLVGGPYSQNAVWLNGEPHVVPAVHFAYDPQDITGHPWNISTPDRALDLTFHPLSERYENIDLLLVASRLHQPFGRFEGVFRTPEGERSIRAFGFCEEHYAKW